MRVHLDTDFGGELGVGSALAQKMAAARQPTDAAWSTMPTVLPPIAPSTYLAALSQVLGRDFRHRRTKSGVDVS